MSAGVLLRESKGEPPAYRERWPGEMLVGLRLKPLEFFPRVISEYGDVVRLRFGSSPVYLINDPELIREVLVTHDRRFSKGPGLRVAERLLGQGLLTSEGAFHRRQRRLAQPAFHRQRVAAYGRVMAEYAEQSQQLWRDGQELDLAEEMRGLTLRIAAKTLFDTNLDSDIQDITAALTESMLLYRWAMLPLAAKLESLLPFLTRRFNQARAKLDRTVYRMIAERRASGEDRGDLLSMLLLARDEEADGGQMSDAQIRDEAMTLLLAGHETTANALAWTWHLLAENPDAEAKLHAELDAVLGGRTPEAEDVPSLTYTRQVFTEAMRLYPPAWVVARKAIEECPLPGFTLPAGTLVLMSEWVTHRDARYYREPLKFAPERWSEDTGLPKFAYYPFGGGSRVCIGEQFAWMEGVLVLAAIASRWRFRSVPGHPIVPQPLITLRPKHGVRVKAHRRGATLPAPQSSEK